MRLSLIAGCLLMAVATAHADQPVSRPVSSSYMVEFGTSHLADTYLTPLHYTGQHLALSYQRFQSMKFDPANWVMNLEGAVSMDHTRNPARNATLWNLDLQVRWAMMCRWQVVPRLTLAIGPMTAARGGVLYSSRNGNNPASAKAAWELGAKGVATYKMRIKKLPVTFGYQASLPVTGAFFSPDYGELYYEIYLGDTSGLAHMAWFGNYFRLDNLVTADLNFGATTLRLGYHCDILSTKANDIVSRNISHSFVIGITTDWISLDRRRPQPQNIVEPLF